MRAISQLFAVVLASTVTLSGPAVAQTTSPAKAGSSKPLSIEDVWRRPAIAEPRLSPNGRYFAVLAPVNDRLNIAIIDLETRKGVAITSYKDFDVADVNWVGNERLTFTLAEFGAPSGAGLQEGGGFFMVTRDGKEARQLSPTIREIRRSNTYAYRAYQFLQRVPDSDEEIIAQGNLRSIDSSDVYRLNVRTGRAVLLTPERPERVLYSEASEDEAPTSWVLDRNLIPRLAVSNPKDTNLRIVHYRKSENSPWVELVRYDAIKGPAFVPQYFMSDNQTLVIATNAGRDSMALFKYDPEAKKLGEMIASHPRFDMGADQQGSAVPGLLLDPKTEEIVGFRVRGDKTETVWVDERYQRLQQMINAALPDTLNIFARTPDGNRLIVTSVSDRQSTRWYLLDEQKKTLEELFASRPWLKPEQMAEMRPFTLKTRDGLEISSYYFLPPTHKKGDKLPTIVHVHGGPHVRADWWGQWSFGVREAQLFASRGYAVILPNHRITPGLGSKVYYSGFGAYGKQMVEDHIDAVKWGIDEGFVDPSRVCVSGASYGGSAVLLSMAMAPELFKCGVAGLVVADKKLQLTSSVTDFARNKSSIDFWLRILGAESTSTIPAYTSPVELASRIKGPILMYAGVDDQRTPLEQTRAMQSALERAGNPPKAMVVKAEEGHGFGKLENNVDLYNQVFKFVDQNIGSGAK